MSLITDLNYIRKIVHFPCAVPGPIIFIETAFSAAVPTLYELVAFSCRDILKTRAGISWKCGRILKAIIKQAHDPMIVDELHHLYKLFEPIDKLLWYLFLAELISKFVANWTSMLYVAQQCKAPDNTTANSMPGPYIGNFGGTDYGAPVQPWDLHIVKCCTTTPFGFDVRNPCAYSILWTATMTQLEDFPVGSIATRIVRTNDGKIVAQNDGRRQINGTWGSASYANFDEIIGGVPDDHYLLEWFPQGYGRITGQAVLTSANIESPLRPGGCNLAKTHTV